MRNQLPWQGPSRGRQDMQEEIERTTVDLLIADARRHMTETIPNSLQNDRRKHRLFIEIEISNLVKTTELVLSLDLDGFVNDQVKLLFPFDSFSGFHWC
ncbi:MAG: hypothetical protein GY835_10045 [bacterium]|nr:hypothetical protein [bacterium]